MSVLNRPYFYDEKAAFEHVESIVWADGRSCPHCGNLDKHYKLEGVRSKASKKHPEGIERHGLYKCAECRKQFTVRIGTIFEESHIPLHKWLQAIHLLCSSKKGISSNQLHRTLEITLKSAWFLSHRIREAMRTGKFAPMGGAGSAVEVDETFIGREPGMQKRSAWHHKLKVLSLVDRASGEVRSVVVDNLRAETVVPILRENIAAETAVMTDEATHYKRLDETFASHGVVNHNKKEYVRGDVYTNTVEGYFSIFKRGMKGIYQHCEKQHLHRYLAEYDFRYNNRLALGVDDSMRAMNALVGAKGKRLTYQGPSI